MIAFKTPLFIGDYFVSTWRNIIIDAYNFTIDGLRDQVQSSPYECIENRDMR